MHIKIPDFFIVGAPKCGTTALNEYLRAHPEIYIPDAKEFHFFGSDLKSDWFKKDVNTYLSHFSPWKNEKRGGEASVWYLYSKNAAEEIKQFSPDSLIIIMLRNPVDMLYSLYYQFLYNGNEDLPSFKEALCAEEDRKKGIRIPKTSHFVQGLYYTEVAKFTEQVKRYFDVFERERIYIIIFDDFKNDNSVIYKEVLEFLGVDSNFKPEYKIINPHKRVRSQVLQDFLRTPPSSILSTIRLLLPQSIRRSLATSIKNLNIKYEPRSPMDSQFRSQLLEKFKPEIERLSILLDRDLTYWAASN